MLDHRRIGAARDRARLNRAAVARLSRRRHLP
jgi:hypothetical protein